MKLSKLLIGIADISKDQDTNISGLCSDSRNVQQGDCFFALKGLSQDGRDFIPEAIQRGASAIIVDEAPPSSSSSLSVVELPNLLAQLGEIAARFYKRPADDLIMMGITGTNGKTSTSQYIAMALEMAKTRCGVIGTLGYGFPNNLHPQEHTTSDPITLQRQLSELSLQGAEAIAMEVSSHALAQYRTEGVRFDIAIFTNLTRDHLDFHGTMENYGESKRRLFYSKGLKQAVINTDDDFGLTLASSLQNSVATYTYGLEPAKLDLPHIRAHHVHCSSKGITAKIESPWGNGVLRSRLLGRFNLSNLLAVLCTLLNLELPFDTALNYIAHLSTVPGRLQVFGGGKLPLVVVDYAHTPDALMQALLALREHTQNTLWCLFGCGGDRDRGKRPLMGQIAERCSDQLVITDDNPRTEDPARIIADIRQGLLCPWASEVIHDREAAIAHVIDCAHAGDVILVAGKGHEKYQLIGDEKIPFSDSEHIQNHLKIKSKQ